LRTAVRLGPKYVAAWRNLGNTCLEQKDYAGAAEAYRAATELDPQDWRNYNQMGLALLRQERWGAAADVFRDALKVAPQNATLHNSLAIALARGGLDPSGDLDAAVAEFREAARLDPRFQNNLDTTLKLLAARDRLAPPPREVKRP
jgi:tetratricopeptide (TPR) repeat protein